MKKNKIIIISTILLIILLVIVSRISKKEEIKSDKLIKDVYQSIDQRVNFPKDEDGLIATITDPQKLKAEQPFYDNVEIGDIMILFPKNKRAVLYRPSNDTIIKNGLMKIVEESKEEVSNTNSTSTKATTTKQIKQ